MFLFTSSRIWFSGIKYYTSQYFFHNESWNWLNRFGHKFDNTCGYGQAYIVCSKSGAHYHERRRLTQNNLNN